jgi:hypothetical protein
MKRKSLFVAFSAFMVATALVASGLSLNTAKATTLEQLNAKAGDYCKQCGCAVDCRSGATGNIYSGYEAEGF